MKSWISNLFLCSSRYIVYFIFLLQLQVTRETSMAENAYFTLTWDSSELEKVHTYLIELTWKPRWNVAMHHFNVKKCFSSIRKFGCDPNKNAKMGYRLPISVLLNIHPAHMGRFLNSKHFACWNFILKILSIFCHSSVKSTMVFNEDSLSQRQKKKFSSIPLYFRFLSGLHNKSMEIEHFFHGLISRLLARMDIMKTIFGCTFILLNRMTFGGFSWILWIEDGTLISLKSHWMQISGMLDLNAVCLEFA